MAKTEYERTYRHGQSDSSECVLHFNPRARPGDRYSIPKKYRKRKLNLDGILYGLIASRRALKYQVDTSPIKQNILNHRKLADVCF